MAGSEWVIDGLPDEYQQHLRAYVKDVQRVYGDSLDGVLLYGSAVRGDEVEQMRAVADGKLEGFAGSVGGTVPVPLLPELAALELPYLFRTEDGIRSSTACVAGLR